MNYSKALKYVLNKETMHFHLFPEYMNHSSIAGDWDTAGYCRIFQDDDNQIAVSCYGRSESLGLSSDGPEDSKFLSERLREFVLRFCQRYLLMGSFNQNLLLSGILYQKT